jgi:Flp pilus assembly protein TadG
MGKWGRQRGATLVEAALVLPIIILLTVSLLELGLAFREFLTLSFTAREAARVGSLAGRGQRLTGKDNGLVEMPGPRAS